MSSSSSASPSSSVAYDCWWKGSEVDWSSEEAVSSGSGVKDAGGVRGTERNEVEGKVTEGAGFEGYEVKEG